MGKEGNKKKARKRGRWHGKGKQQGKQHGSSKAKKQQGKQHGSRREKKAIKRGRWHGRLLSSSRVRKLPAAAAHACCPRRGQANAFVTICFIFVCFLCNHMFLFLGICLLFVFFLFYICCFVLFVSLTAQRRT
jgi:hypothetical protein